MKHIYNIWFFILSLNAISSYAQTPGINYQAFVTNMETIEIPGSDIENNKMPLINETVNFRFSITDVSGNDLYIEEQATVTDEYGLISLIIGEGVALFSSFNAISWDGTPKFLNIEIDIINDDLGYVVLDSQKILYLPQRVIGMANLQIVDNLPISSQNYTVGDMLWLSRFNNGNHLGLYVWNGNAWVTRNDFANLFVILNDSDRDSKITNPSTGYIIWNETCNCIQLYNGIQWISVNLNTLANNGLTKTGNTIELGGQLTKPTSIVTSTNNTLAINGLENTSATNNTIMVVDPNTGILRTTPSNNIIQLEEDTVIADNNQNQFSTPLPATDKTKIKVYRNGILIDYDIINTNTIQLETGIFCHQGDLIRIIQFN